MDTATENSSNFITEIIDDDLKTGSPEFRN